MFAEATEQGIKDGLRNSGFVPANGEAEGSPRMALWLTGGDLKALPPHEEKPPETAANASEGASQKKGRTK